MALLFQVSEFAFYNHLSYCGPCVSLTLCCFVVYSTRRFVVCLSMCHFVLVFFSPFSIAITSLREERANLSAFRTFVRFVLVWIGRFPLPLVVWEGLRFVIVALPGLFSYLFFPNSSVLHLWEHKKNSTNYRDETTMRTRQHETTEKPNFSEQFRKLINPYKRIGYSLDIMRQTACLVVNPVIVDGYASLFNCTTADRASDSMMAFS